MRDAYNPHAPLRPAEDPPLSRPHVLIVDDEELYRHALERILGRSGYTISCAPDAAQALEIASQQPLDLVICDVRMPGISGLELVRQIHDLDPDVPCIVVTGYGGAEQSVEALHAGAFWYLEKPFEQRHLDVVRRLVEQAIEHRRLRSENRRLQRELRSRHGFESIVGQSPALARVLQTVEKVAASDSTVLITGESGSGKELIAQAIHYNSARADRVLVTVNCGAIPEELLESELFGHVRGAFTNAVRDREGRFAMAEGGTIFLDEIGDMSPNLQVKLLRVLQERSFEPVGSSRTQRVDVRVIAATHQVLAEKIRSQEFREDLYYRLNVIPIEVPPLRERRDDIPLLAEHFLRAFESKHGRGPLSIDPEAMEVMCAYAWPGNVRELQNWIERAAALCRGRSITAADIPRRLRERLEPIDSTRLESLQVLERSHILNTLECVGWNRRRAAEILQISTTTLWRRLKQFGIDVPSAANARRI